MRLPAIFLILFLDCCLIASDKDRNTSGSVQEAFSSNLPIVIISTNGKTIGNAAKIVADMGIIYKGEGVRNLITDPYNDYNGKIAIELRGSSSQMFPKNLLLLKPAILLMRI